MHLSLFKPLFRTFLYGTILPALFLAQPAFAETVSAPVETGIKGKVIDKSSSRALEYATVMIFQSSDSSFVTGGITGANGSFEIKLKPGQYDVAVQFLAYGTIRVSNIAVERGQQLLDLGELMIAPDATNLNEIEVIAEKSQVEMSLDKRVFNVGKDISSKAGNAMEVLQNIPSVTVDIEGNISLRGDEGVRVLIDGRMSGLAGINSRDALRSLQADMIERVEIVTNPSVRYDASGTSGIINIVLRKDRRQGFNGSVDASTGYPLQAGIGLSANYRKNKWNLFANYALNYNERIGSGDLLKELNTSALYTTKQARDRHRTGYSNTIRLGADYNINPLNMLTFSLMYRYSDQTNTSTISYHDFTDNVLTGNSERVDNEQETDPNLEYALNYKKQFKRKDQLLTASLQYFDNSEVEQSKITETFYMSPAPVLPDPVYQKSKNSEVENNVQLQADYFHPFTGKAKLETGLKLESRTIGNDYAVSERDSLGDYVAIAEFTNRFEYKENILAAYLLFGNDAGRYSYQVGLRAEYSDINTLLKETNESNSQNYFDFFPSAHFTWKLTEKDNLQLSYSRRIRRPDFGQLNPFRSYTDNRYIWTGNPGLKPVYTDSYELGYLRYWDKSSFNATAYYRYSTDVFQRIETLDSTGITYVRPENFASSDAYGLELIGAVFPFKWWSLNANLNFFRTITDGEANDIVYHTDYYSWTGRINNRMTITKGFDLQLAGNYQASMDTPQGKRLPSWFIDLGLSKEVLKGKGTLTLNVKDLFGTRTHSFETFGENYYTRSEFRWNSTVVTLNLNYRINQAKKRQTERREQMEDGGGMEF